MCNNDGRHFKCHWGIFNTSTLKTLRCLESDSCCVIPFMTLNTTVSKLRIGKSTILSFASSIFLFYLIFFSFSLSFFSLPLFFLFFYFRILILIPDKALDLKFSQQFVDLLNHTTCLNHLILNTNISDFEPIANALINTKSLATLELHDILFINYMLNWFDIEEYITNENLVSICNIISRAPRTCMAYYS